MLYADFLATLPPVAGDCFAQDREARRSGATRDPFGTPDARALAAKLFGQYETTMGPQDLDEGQWTELAVNLRGYTDQDWAALQRNRAANQVEPTSSTEDTPTHSQRKKRRE